MKELTYLCEQSLIAEDRFINETALLGGLLSSHLWKPLSLSLTSGPAAVGCLWYQVQAQMISAELVHHAPFLICKASLFEGFPPCEHLVF